MKKLVGISLFIFWSLTTAIIIAGLVFYQDNKISIPLAVPSSPQQSVASSGAGNINITTVLDAQEVSKHNSSADCWMIINDKIYNFTDYLNIHPGGAYAMIPYCGKDGTQAFDTKDKRNSQPHSSYADSLLVKYYVGNLNQTINISQIENKQNIGGLNIQNTNTDAAGAKSGRVEDDD